MTSELIKPGTHQILMRKHVSALDACSPLVTTCDLYESLPPARKKNALSVMAYLPLIGRNYRRVPRYHCISKSNPFPIIWEI